MPFRRMPLSRFLPKISGLPCSSWTTCSLRASFSVMVVPRAVVEDVAILQNLDVGGALDAPRLFRVSFKCCWKTSTERATKVASAPIASESGLERAVRGAERSGFRFLAEFGCGRILAFGEPVDLIVEHQHFEADVAPQHVNGVIAADGQGVAVAGGHPDFEIGARDLEAGGDGGRAAVNRVEAEGVHVIREAAGAADAGNEHEIFARDAPAPRRRTARRRGWRSRRSRGTSGFPGRSENLFSCRQAMWRGHFQSLLEKLFSRQFKVKEPARRLPIGWPCPAFLRSLLRSRIA
jgi:hypothetical protein